MGDWSLYQWSGRNFGVAIGTGFCGIHLHFS